MDMGVVLAWLNGILDEADRQGYVNEYEVAALRDYVQASRGPPSRIPKPPRGGGSPPREKRKPTPYMKAKAKHFKKIQSRYKKKSGGWRKGGFGACSREAGRLAKAELKKQGGRKR